MIQQSPLPQLDSPKGLSLGLTAAEYQNISDYLFTGHGLGGHRSPSLIASDTFRLQCTQPEIRHQAFLQFLCTFDLYDTDSCCTFQRIVACVFFAFSIPTHNQLGNSTQPNIDGAHIQALLLLMQCFTSARRYGLGWGSEALNGGLIFWQGLFTTF